MIRCTHHSLKWITKEKKQLLDRMYSDYMEDLQFYVDLIWNKELPLEKRLSSSLLSINKMQKSHWRAICYAEASSMIRSGKQHKNTSKPEIKDVTLELDANLFDVEFQDEKMFFNEFVKIVTPYLEKAGKTKYQNKYFSLNVPIKYHTHFRKYQDWKRKNCIFIKKVGSEYHLFLVFEKEAPPKKLSGKEIGIDQGKNKLFVTNEDQRSIVDFASMYKRILNKVRNSKNFDQTLVTRNRLINEEINVLIKSNPDLKHIIIENLKNVKKNIAKKDIEKDLPKQQRKNKNRQLQHWVYPKVVDKLERICQENGILLTKVDPAYTSQMCSKCGAIHEESRPNGSTRFKCIACGMEMDADLNASINILRRGAIDTPSTTEKSS